MKNRALGKAGQTWKTTLDPGGACLVSEAGFSFEAAAK